MTDPEGYDVSPEILTNAAKGIADVINELTELGVAQTANQGRGLELMVMFRTTIGHDGLTEAWGDFLQRWEYGVRGLVQEGDKFANKLHDAGIGYEHHDIGASEIFKRAAFDLAGDPRGDSAQAMEMSWGQLGDATVGRLIDPDYSPESFENAGQDAIAAAEQAGDDITSIPDRAEKTWDETVELADDVFGDGDDPQAGSR